MPYIPGTKRIGLVEGDLNPLTPGELNYLFSYIINEYIRNKGKNYATLNEVVGALECCKLELYRRVAAPYEDDKIRENGDVYTV